VFRPPSHLEIEGSEMLIPMRTQRAAAGNEEWSKDELLLADEVECKAIVDMAAAMPQRSRARLGIAVESTEGATIVTAQDNPTYLFNRVFGLGLRDRTTRERVAEIVKRARARSERFLVHVSPHARPADIEAWLEQAGVERYARAWWKLMARTEALASPFGPPPDDVSVERATAANIDEVAQVLDAAFGFESVAASTFGTLVDRPAWTVLRATIAGETVGAGLLFVHDRVAYLAGGATTTSARRRGVHRALLLRRFEEARQLGCRIVVSETGEDLPGESGPSLRNMMRLGLERVYLRANFAPIGMPRFSG
jgi:GNAT superfamily N-acetyltransferase